MGRSLPSQQPHPCAGDDAPAQRWVPCPEQEQPVPMSPGDLLPPHPMAGWQHQGGASEEGSEAMKSNGNMSGKPGAGAPPVSVLETTLLH